MEFLKQVAGIFLASVAVTSFASGNYLLVNNKSNATIYFTAAASAAEFILCNSQTIPPHTNSGYLASGFCSDWLAWTNTGLYVGLQAAAIPEAKNICSNINRVWNAQRVWISGSKGHYKCWVTDVT